MNKDDRGRAYLARREEEQKTTSVLCRRLARDRRRKEYTGASTNQLGCPVQASKVESYVTAVPSTRAPNDDTSTPFIHLWRCISLSSNRQQDKKKREHILTSKNSICLIQAPF